MEYNKEYAKKVYAGLTKRGYTADELGDETKFVERMADEGNRKYLYDQVQKRGDAKMGSWERFNSKMMEVAPVVEAEPQQGFFTGVKAQIADIAKQAMQKPRGGENGYTFTADELGVAEGKGKVEAEPTSVTTATAEVAAPVKTEASAAVPGERSWWQNAAKIMGKEETKPQMYGPMTKELMEEQQMLVEGRSIPEADIEAALPQANASLLQKMHEGATMQGAFDRAYGAAKGVYFADEAERLTKGLLDEYSAERAKRLSQVEKDVENYNSARRWAVSNPYATDAYSEVAYRSNAMKLRNADELGMMEEFAKDAKKRILADENLKAKAEENAELLGMPVERYINEVAVPIMQERMYSEWLAPQEERAKRNYNGFAAAAEGSLIGTLLGATRTDTEKYLSQVGQEAWRENASLLGRAAAGAGSMFLDLPVFMGAGSLAAQPAKAVGGQVFKQLAKNETKRLVARGVAEGAAQRYANYAVRNGLKNRILLNLSTAPLQSGLTFGMFDAGKAALNMSLSDEWDWKELGKSAVGGTLMGGALGATGAVGGGLTHGLTGATKAAAKVAEFGVENAVFTEGGRLIGKLHGQQPENGWLEDYVESGATLLMIKAPNIVKNVSAIKGDKEASEVFAFNRLEREQLGKYGKDLNAVLASLLPQSKRVFEDGLKINEGTFTEEYRRVMSDPEVSMTTKAKLMGIVEGKVMPAPKVVDAQIEGNRVMTYDPMGRLVEVKEYATKTKAEAEYKKAADKAEIESIAVMEDIYVRIKGYEADDVTVREWLAKNPDVTAEDIANIIAKNSAGEKLTEGEQRILESLRKARHEGLNDVRFLNDVLAELNDAGVDVKAVMSGIEKPIDERTEAENRAVKAYTDVLYQEIKAKVVEPFRRGEARRAEDIDTTVRLIESDRSVDETANDGMVYTTTTPSGEKIIITGGKVVLDNEGYIDVNQSEGLVAMFPDGQKKPVRPGDLREKVEVSNAEEIKAAKREEIKQEVAAENGWKALVPGAEIEIAFDGEVYKLKVEGRDERGDVILSGEGESMAVPESLVQEGMKEAETLQAEIGKALQTEIGKVEGENGEVAQESTTSVPPVEENAPVVEQTQPVAQTALERVPKAENGEPIYEQADAETAWDAIMEQANDEELATQVVEGMIADKEAALKKLENSKVREGVTVAEKIAAAQQRKAAIEQAKADLAKWQEIAGVKAKRALAAEAEKKILADEAAARLRAEEERLRAEREAAERAEREALNGVPDMVDDKPQDARARGYRRVNGHKVDRQEPVQGLMGKEIAVKFSDSSIPTGRIAVIEAEQLQPSHIQGQRNPLHFIDEAQPKERNDAASVLSARKIAENVRPEEITSSVTAYTGAPTVNARGEAVQGNNRSAALRLMWENNPEQAAKYKQYLMEHAAEFGLNAEEIAAMKSPVLVNMLDVSDADAITLGQYVAQDTESGGTERIKPKNVMQKMGGDMRSFANRLLASNNEEASFAELVDANGVEVLKWMAQKGYITPTQYKSAFDSKGNLTAEVKNDLRDVMYQSIFKGGSTQLEEMFNALPAKAQKAILATAFRDYDSPNAERMNGEVQNSIRAYYALARDAAFANAKNYKEAKEAAMMWARQYQLDDVSGESFLPSENFSNFAIELAVVYKGWAQRNLQNHFNNIYDLVQGTKEASLFEEADNTPRTLKEAIKETFNIDYNGQSNSNSLAIDSKDGQARKRGGNGDIATGERIEGGERPADSTGGARGNGEVSSPEIPNNLNRDNVSQVEGVAEGGNAPGQSGVAAKQEFEPKTELQQGELELDRENPAFERATENVRKKLKTTGVKVNVLTKEEAEKALAELEAMNGVEKMSVSEAKKRADAIESLSPINITSNTKTKEELNADYKSLPSVKKGGKMIEFYNSAFKKIYKEGGLFAQIVPQLDKILEQSVMAYYENDNLGGIVRPDGTVHKAHPNISKFYNYIGKVKIGGKEYYVRTTVKEEMSGQSGTHSYMVTDVSLYDKTTKSLSLPITTRARGTLSGIVDAKLKDFFDYANGITKNPEFMRVVGEQRINKNQEIFVSNARKAVEEIKQEKATPQQWLAMIKKNGGLKVGEDKWMGLSEWLENSESKSLTKQEVLDFVNENAIKIEEVEYEDLVRNEGFDAAQDVMLERFGDDFSIAFDDLGGELVIANEDAAATLLGSGNIINSTRLDYTTEGLENKREIALVVPTIEPYNQSDEIHFGDAGEGRAVAWVRFGETTDSEGNRVLVIDEIQSKRHQDGREKGYKSQADRTPATMDELSFGEYNGMTTVSLRGERFFFKSSTSENEILDIINERIAAGQLGSANGLVPDAPFEKNWQELAMKRMLRLAAEEGFDKVAWTTGEQQAERYNLGAVVNRIESTDTVDYDSKLGVDLVKQVVLFTQNGDAITLRLTPEGIVRASSQYNGHHISDIVGKELGNRIMTETDLVLKEQDLRIGGEGMKGFYDKMLSSFVSKYTKKWGAKVGTVEMPSLEQNNVMHSVDVTPEMKESVMEGQPMFLRTSDGTTYGWAVNGEIYLTPEGLNPNTPIHEYTHLWAAALQKSNPKLWGEVVEAMKLSPAWNEVMADENYTGIHGDENRVASEVLSRLSGNEGYRRYMEQAEAEIAAERNIGEKVRKKGILNRIKNAVSRFWNWLKGKLGSKAKAGDGTEAKTEPWEVFVNKALKDFDEGVNPDAKDSPLDRMFIGKKVDREGNVIGDGSSHVEYKVDEVALSYPNISYKVNESATTESVYVTYYNNDPKYPENERPKVTVRYSTHESNAVKFGDQLRGHMFDESTPTGKRLAERQTNILLTRLGLKKAIPVYGKYIPNRQVSNKDIAQGVYEEADKTIQEMYDLPIGADISQYKGKFAKGSRYLIEGDEVMRGEVKDYKFVDAAEKEPAEGGIVENNANFVSTYKTEDGKDINYTSERAEGYGVQGYGTDSSNSETGHSILQRQTDTGVPGGNSGLNTEKGEFCVVERVFTENGAFNFTSGEKIESADDVAYIFSALEDAAKEHSFVVYVKDGKPTVVELGMGSFNATMVDIPTASLAYSRINPDHVYFVHNHPSGNLICSDLDVKMLREFEGISDVPVTGVIINLKTGKYGTFDTERHSAIGEKRVPENEERLTVHTLDKQIFAPDYDPMTQPLVRSSQDVAQFLNSQRMGDRPKVSFLILSRANRIIGNIHTPFTDITTDVEAVARYINERIIQFGGENAVLYGDFAISYDEAGGFRLLQNAMERFGKTKLLDVVRVEGNFTKSANDYGFLYEPEADYGVVKESEQGYGSTEEDIPVGEVESKPLTFAKKITNSVLEASAKNKENLALRSDALRMFGRDVANVLKLMGKQREYDKSTVDQLVKLAKMYFKDAQLLGGLTPYQVGRVMTRLNSAVGKRDITDDANELVNILVDAHNKELDRMLDKAAKTKAKKVNASGVEVIGKLDKEGQLLLEEYNTGKELDIERIDEKIIDLQNEAAEGKAEEAAARIRGLELARQYREEILAKQTEIKGLEQELKSAEQDAKDGAMDRAAYKEFRRATERAILESKLEMVDAYHGLIHGLGGDISSSAKRAKLFQQQQIDHVKEIQHNANSDLLGHPAEAQGETPDKWNSSVPRLFMSAMPTFQTMLKFFGEKAADGRGYLYERFIPQHTQASHNEYVGKTEAREKMRDKLTEIFGKKTTIENFMDMSRKEGAVLEYQEGGQKKTIDLTRGQVLYLYMINKMADGQMKLSRMGITDADVQKMANELPEEFVRFADWVQEQFLTELRDKYNAVHERMFGAPMAAIESYFPIKINKRSRGEKIEPGMNAEDKPSTVTGSVIKRTKNAVAIDLSADAMQVLLGHIDDMENWAAWAEFRRDLKSLLNYRHFQNQVKGMESLRYGSGEKLWKNFVDVANIAAGSFKPSSSAVDKAVRNIAKGVVSSKIAFRYFTAVKQILSTPAFWSEVDFGKMMNAYLHQKEAWDWAMKNLPGFSKRWEGRASGNEILLESDADWKVWQNRAVQWLSKKGMRANAFIDALTVATGAKAVFETKYEMFKKAGYSEVRAREKALNRAAEAYNESQQSSESAYLSPLQAEATFVSSVLTAYRNSPFGYNRKMATAIANLKKKMKKGFKQESIEYMIKQLMRDGLNEEQAKKFAKSTYRRSVARDAADVALYEFFLNYVWVLGPSLIYILGGDDDDKKKELNVEALIDGAMGGLGNLPAGETLTGAIKAIAEGDVSNFKLPQAVAMQDMETIADLMQTDPVRAAGEVLNILVAMGVGVNPQTFTDMFVALADTEDWSDPREIAMLVLRLINAPNSKLELLEADKAMENYGEKMEEITREYAEYQKSKRAPLTGWLYSDEAERKALERYEKRFKKILDERFETIVENADEYDMWYENSDPQMKAKLAKLRQKFLEGDKETTMEKLDSIDVTKKVLFGSGYDKVNTVYYELSTAEDEDMAMMIDQKLKELKPMMDEYNKLTGDDKKTYREKNLEDIQLYNKLNGRKSDVNTLKGVMKKKPEKAQEKMEKIRKIRTKAVELINNYNE